MLQMAIVCYACFVAQILDSTILNVSVHMLCALFRAIPMELKVKCTELKDSMWVSQGAYMRGAYFDGSCT